MKVISFKEFAERKQRQEEIMERDRQVKIIELEMQMLEKVQEMSQLYQKVFGPAVKAAQAELEEIKNVR